MGYGNQEVEKGDEKKGRPCNSWEKEGEEPKSGQPCVWWLCFITQSAAGASSKENQRDAFHPALHGQLLFLSSSNLDTFDDLKSGCEPASSTSLPSGTSTTFQSAPIGGQK
jgi:hypothetical protein